MFQYGEIEPIISISSSLATNAAIGVIRLSGFKDILDLDTFFSIDFNKLNPGTARRSQITFDNVFYDDVLIIYFKAPFSYTGENVLEISAHGNLVILRNIVNLFIDRCNFRQAKPGEFTYRALLNKKLSLSQVEGLDLLLNANNSLMINAGHSVMSGVLHENYRKLQNDYLMLRSHIELGFDFLEDVGEDFFNQNLQLNFNNLESTIKALYAQTNFSFDSLNHLSLVLFGKPNAGKSTIFNMILGRERSIVSPIAGTTRDYISEKLLIHNNYYELIDTAGVHESDDLIELKGIEFTRNLLSRAFFKILVIKANEVDPVKFDGFDFVIVTHCDELPGPIEPSFLGDFTDKIIFIDNHSTVVDRKLFNCIAQKLNKLKPIEFIAIERHRNVISGIYDRWSSLSQTFSLESDLAIISHELNTIGHLIEELVGIVSPDDVLNNIFTNFCIGK